MKNTPRNMAASVHRRLLNIARASGRPFNELLQHYAMERYLYRLSKSRYADRFILKGALMLRVWESPVARPTLDIDLLGRTGNDPEALAAIMKEVCGQPVEPDGLEFDGSTVTSRVITEEVDYAGVRIRFRGRLGTARIVMQIDIGFGDVVTPEPTETEYPTLLDLPAPRLVAYPRETAVAEKFQVMLSRAQLNSRLRDYYDVWLLSRGFPFAGELLARAIRKTCEHRETRIVAKPRAFSDEFANDAARQTQWRAFRRKSMLDHAPAELTELVHAVREFLGPIAETLAGDRSFTGSWPPSGPWQPS